MGLDSIVENCRLLRQKKRQAPRLSSRRLLVDPALRVGVHAHSAQPRGGLNARLTTRVPGSFPRLHAIARCVHVRFGTLVHREGVVPTKAKADLQPIYLLASTGATDVPR